MLAHQEHLNRAGKGFVEATPQPLSPISRIMLSLTIFRLININCRTMVSLISSTVYVPFTYVLAVKEATPSILLFTITTWMFTCGKRFFPSDGKFSCH